MEKCRSPTMPKKLTLPPSKPIYIGKRSHPTYPVGTCSTSPNKLLHRLLQDNECSNNQSILMECSKIRPEYLGSFVYNDHITNRGMVIGDDVMFYNCNYSPNNNNVAQCNNNSISNIYAKLRYSHKDNYSNSNDISIYNSNTNLNTNQNVHINTSCATIKECFDLMKSTRKFHLNSLQARNYKNRVFKDKSKITAKQKQKQKQIQKSKEISKQNDRYSYSSFNSFSINSSNSTFNHNHNHHNHNHKCEQQYEQQDYAKMARIKLQKYLKKRQNQQQNFKKDKCKLAKMLENSFSQNRVGNANTNQKNNEIRENKRKLSYKQQNKVKQGKQNNNQTPPYLQRQRQRNRLTFPSWNKQISTKERQQNQQIIQQYKQFQKQKSISQIKVAYIQNSNDDQNGNLNAKQNNQKKLKKKGKKPKTKVANRPLCSSSNSNSKLALNGNEQFASKWQQKQQQLIQSTNNQLRYFIRKNGQFLVTPDLSKRLLRRQQNSRLGNSCSSTNARDKCRQMQMRDRQKQNIKKLRMSTISMTRQKQSQIYSLIAPQSPNSQYFNPSQLQQYKFPCPQMPQIPKCPVSLSPAACPKHPLICQIQRNNYFKIQIQLSLQPSLLYVKQPTNDNNLLHICVMNGRYEVYMMIVGKCEQFGVDLLNQRNRYGRNPVQLGKLLEFFKYGQGSSKGNDKMWDKI